MSEQSTLAGKKVRRPHVPYTALTLDANYCVCTYGEAASGLFGHPEVSILGKHVSNILPALSPKQEKASAQPSEQIKFSEVRMEARHADGNTFPVMVGMRQDCLHGTCRHLVLIRNLEERQQI